MDPIANFITAIRNGYLAKKETIIVPSSKQRQALADILAKYGFLKQVEIIDDKSLQLTLNYLPDGAAVLTHIKRISKPGVRRYTTSGKMPVVLSGAGISIISTSAGLLTNREAKGKHLGGEVICQLW